MRQRSRETLKRRRFFHFLRARADFVGCELKGQRGGLLPPAFLGSCCSHAFIAEGEGKKKKNEMMMMKKKRAASVSLHSSSSSFVGMCACFLEEER